MATVTNGARTSYGSLERKFPEIVLDTTLAELLAEDHPSYTTHEAEALCNIKPCADPRHKSLPTNKKYLITSSQASDADDLAHLQLENVSYLLSFWAGHMEVPLVACEGFSKDDTLTVEVIDQNAKTSYSALNEKQRPWPKVFANKDDFTKHFEEPKTKVRWAFAVDFAEQIPCFVPPELTYKLNSKRWLAENSLRSAHDKIIDPEGFCDTHKTKEGLWYFSHDCTQCEKAIDKELNRLEDILKKTEPPYVLKITQSLGSVGTMLVKNEEDKTKAIEQVTDHQRDALPHVTTENAHIYPASLVLSAFLPGDTHALNFFVRRDGSVRFLGSCQQLSTRTTGSGHQHTALTWDKQATLEKRFRETLADIGKTLHAEGYFGPCGADIMEDDDEHRTQYVIDLNVRTSTSTILGVLNTHCKARDFNACAVYECLLLNKSRGELEDEFADEFEQGRLILLGNTRLGKKKVWAYPLVLAGEDIDTIEKLGKRILKFEAKDALGAADAGGA